MKAWTLAELRARCFITVRECWEWRLSTGAQPTSEHARRHPIVKHEGEMFTVRRLALQLSLGRELEPHLFAVPVKCRNPRCQSPFHSKAVNEQTKTRLAALDGSFSTPERAAAIARGKQRATDTGMTMSRARQIRATSGRADDYCAEFGISKSMFNRIRNNKAWKEAA